MLKKANLKFETIFNIHAYISFFVLYCTEDQDRSNLRLSDDIWNFEEYVSRFPYDLYIGNLMIFEILPDMFLDFHNGTLWKITDSGETFFGHFFARCSIGCDPLLTLDEQSVISNHLNFLQTFQKIWIDTVKSEYLSSVPQKARTFKIIHVKPL